MPKPRRNNRKKDPSVNSTIMDFDSKIMDSSAVNLKMWQAEIKDRMKDALRKLDGMQREKMAMFELEFKNSLMGIPKNALNTVVDINSESFRSFILGIQEDNSDTKSTTPTAAPTTVRRRRSRSACQQRLSSQRIHRVRSTSVDIYKTPRGRIRLSTIMSHKKYTVTKPKKTQNSGVYVRRIMKPDEEAISTCGSPLFVYPSSLHAPHVNIPLPGGVVLNIEPKSPDGALEIPGLDAKTKGQIKLLCEQLKKFC